MDSTTKALLLGALGGALFYIALFISRRLCRFVRWGIAGLRKRRAERKPADSTQCAHGRKRWSQFPCKKCAEEFVAEGSCTKPTTSPSTADSVASLSMLHALNFGMLGVFTSLFYSLCSPSTIPKKAKFRPKQWVRDLSSGKLLRLISVVPDPEFKNPKGSDCWMAQGEGGLPSGDHMVQDHHIEAALPKKGEVWVQGNCSDIEHTSHGKTAHQVSRDHNASDCCGKAAVCGCNVPVNFGKGYE